MTQLSQAKDNTPPIVKWLGYGGLLPFVISAAALAIGASHSNLWLQALVGYGAVILSFVGALHWGFAMTHPDMALPERSQSFLWSVVPSLVAWLALLLDPELACALLIIGFLLHLYRDKHVARLVSMPSWYWPLRWRLTLVACLSLLSGWFI